MDEESFGFLRASGKIALLGIFLVWLVFRLFIYYDPQNKCFIKILPSWLEFNNLTVKKAIGVLEQASPEDYQRLCAHVSTIDPNLACGGFGGGCFYARSPRSISISTFNGSLAETLIITVHEVCHAVQGAEGREFSEEECYAEGDRIAEELLEF